MRWNECINIDNEKVNALQKELNVSSLIARLLVLRGITTFDEAKSFFRPQLTAIHDPFLMKDMSLAVDRIIRAIENKERILVFGDYDVDGTTAVSLMSSYLRNYHSEIDTYIPDRYSEGYGISYQGIDYASDNEFGLIIALDCGIKSVDHIEYAKAKGIDFIICDHHLPGPEVPKAWAVLDPKQEDCAYPFKELCGCGVGFKLIQAIHQTLKLPFEELYPYLDLVAVAIAADIVPIVDENRILAYYGLQVLNNKSRPGLHALMKTQSVHEFTITDVVFKIAPKINAAGRMQHGRFAVQLLTEFNLEEAEKVAKEIELFNADRKKTDHEITQEALHQIKENSREDVSATVVYAAHWHKGVIGIVASRLIESYYRPTLVFTKSGEYLAASARSVKGFDVYKALEACSDHIVQFGGHMYAAGLTIEEKNYQAFKAKFEEVVESQIQPESLEEQLEIDAVINFDELDDKTLRILKQFEPHGPENRHPVFATTQVYDTGNAQVLGKDQNHLRLFVKQNNSVGYPGIAFGFGNILPHIKNLQKLQIAYSVHENVWNEQTSLQLMIKDIRINSEKEIFSKGVK